MYIQVQFHIGASLSWLNFPRALELYYCLRVTLSLFLVTNESDKPETQQAHRETNNVEATCNQILVFPHMNNLHKPVHNNYTC